jgi:hypothetical protein
MIEIIGSAIVSTIVSYLFENMILNKIDINNIQNNKIIVKKIGEDSFLMKEKIKNNLKKEIFNSLDLMKENKKIIEQIKQSSIIDEFLEKNIKYQISSKNNKIILNGFLEKSSFEILKKELIFTIKRDSFKIKSHKLIQELKNK